VKTQHMTATLAGIGLLLCSLPSFAQVQAADPSPFATSSSSNSDWSSPWQNNKNKDYEKIANEHHIGVGLTAGGFIASPWYVSNGGVFELDLVWRHALKHQMRIELGAFGRMAPTRDALLVGVGIPFRMVFRVSDRLEMDWGLGLGYTRIFFSEPFFVPRNGLVATARFSIGYFFDPRIALGITPLGMSVLAGERMDAFVTYEPAIWARFSPI